MMQRSYSTIRNSLHHWLSPEEDCKRPLPPVKLVAIDGSLIVTKDPQQQRELIDAIVNLKRKNVKFRILVLCNATEEVKRRQELLRAKPAQYIAKRKWLFVRSQEDKIETMRQLEIDTLVDSSDFVVDCCFDDNRRGVLLGSESTPSWPHVCSALIKATV